MKPLRLRKNEDRRLRAGHLWVFSNEVDVSATPLTAFEPGDQVEVQDARSAPLGVGYVNPRSLIAVRLVSRDRGARLDRALLKRRLTRALAVLGGTVATVVLAESIRFWVSAHAPAVHDETGVPA